MKVLYIHGYQSSPLEQKVDILGDKFQEVYAPFIDWDNTEIRTNVFKNLSDLIKSEEITHIVGSSMGGQMAFYLASYHDINCLCFNPAFGYRFNDLGLDLGEKKLSEKMIIALGTEDDVVPNSTTIDFLKLNEIPEEKIEIQKMPIGHQIDLDSFKLHVNNLL